MRWIIKAFMQRIFSRFAHPEKLNYFFQYKVTKNLPVSDEIFFQKASSAISHSKTFIEVAKPCDISSVSFYEFGTGWDIIIPLIYYGLGIRHQTLTDIRQNLRLDMVNDSLTRISKYADRLAGTANMPFRYPGLINIKGIRDIKEKFGIDYLTPVDSADTHLPAASFDFISSTETLEHIPKEDILKMLIQMDKIFLPDISNKKILVFCHANHVIAEWSQEPG